MVYSPALSRVLDDVSTLQPHEAVALVQQVIYNRMVSGEPLEVADAADLLTRLLAKTPKMPAALRYTAARAAGDVQAPPFESVREMAVALKRFEVGDRAAVVRGLLARSQPPRRSRLPSLVASVAAIVLSAIGGALVGAHLPKPVTVPIAMQGDMSPLPAEPNASAAVLPAVRSTLGVLPLPRPADTAKPDVVRAIAGDTKPQFSPSFAENGNAVLFHTGHTATEPSAIKAAGAIDGDIRVMTIVDDGARNYHVQLSPDGTRIAFDSDRDGERGVYVAKADGTEVERLTTDGYAAVPTWSPDGSQLAFVRAERDRPRVWNIWIMTLATRDLRRLTAFTYGQTWGASWFRDGRRVAYSHESVLTVRDLQTGAERSYRSPVPGRLVGTPAVSPDGTHVVFQVSASGAWILDLRDASTRCALADPTAEEFAWSPDGTRIAFHSRRDGQWGIWIMAPS